MSKALVPAATTPKGKEEEVQPLMASQKEPIRYHAAPLDTSTSGLKGEKGTTTSETREETFRVGGEVVLVRLKDQLMEIQNGERIRTYDFADIVGVKVKEGELRVHYYPYLTQCCGGGGQNGVRAYRMVLMQHEDASAARQFGEHILDGLYGHLPQPGGDGSEGESKATKGGGGRRQRSILVVCNPFSGKGRSRRNWNRVEPIFRQAGARLNYQETQHAGHATEIVAEIPLAKVCVRFGS